MAASSIAHPSVSFNLAFLPKQAQVHDFRCYRDMQICRGGSISSDLQSVSCGERPKGCSNLGHKSIQEFGVQGLFRDLCPVPGLRAPDAGRPRGESFAQ